MYRITVSFREEWTKDITSESLVRFSEQILSALGCHSVVETCSAKECSFLLENSALKDGEVLLRDQVSEVCQSFFGAIPEEKEIVVRNVSFSTEVWGHLLNPSGGTLRGENPLLTVMERVERLVGAEAFKTLAKEVVAVAPSIVAHRSYNSFVMRSYLFSINDGCGYTTCLNLFSELVQSAGLFSFTSQRSVMEEKLQPQTSGQTDPFEQILNQVRRQAKDGGCLISIDISEWISNLEHPSFRRFLFQLEELCVKNLLVFRVPFLDGEVLDKIRSVLGDILYLRTVTFPPLSMDQLCHCARRRLQKAGFTLSSDGEEVFCSRILEEKSDGHFYGINTVHKIVNEMIYRKHLYIAEHGEDSFEISAHQIAGLVSSDPAAKDGKLRLQDMIGMEEVQRTVEEIVAQIEFSLRNHRARPSLHMRFVGNPGTGKTTVARILGRMLKERGILRQGHFFEYNGRDFCGRYIGETAPKTSAMCRDAYGSVLFIDEAYTLYRGEDNARDFGREALETLLAEMENHRQDLVVIMAGYPDEMENLLKANPGLESRMPYLVEFPNYKREDLIAIFFKLIGSSYTYGEDFREAVEDYFNKIPEDVLTSKTFSNARFVRNLFERTCAKAGMRGGYEGEQAGILTREDFLLASADSGFCVLMEKKNRIKIGF